MELDHLVSKISAGGGGGGATGGRGVAGSTDADSMTRDHWNDAKVG